MLDQCATDRAALNWREALVKHPNFTEDGLGSFV